MKKDKNVEKLVKMQTEGTLEKWADEQLEKQ